MDPAVMDDILFEPSVDALAEMLRIRPGSARLRRLRQMVDLARSIARPKATYRVVRVEDRGEEHVILDGIRFNSRVLRVNLAQAHRTFAYVATCGVEVEEWAQSLPDPFDRFQADAIAGTALMTARQALTQHLEQVYQPGTLSEMNPGSLADWPVREQRPLFDLLGNPQATIGVQLLDSYLMVPTKTTSGLLFPAGDEFYNCQLCPMEDCPGRRAAYDPELYNRKYQPDTEPEPGE
jgi:hypothetical protein